MVAAAARGASRLVGGHVEGRLAASDDLLVPTLVRVESPGHRPAGGGCCWTAFHGGR